MPKISVRPADTMNSGRESTSPFSTEITKNSKAGPPRWARLAHEGCSPCRVEHPSDQPVTTRIWSGGWRTLHVAGRLHRSCRFLARDEAHRLESHVGAVHLVLRVLGDDGDHERQQRLMVLGPHRYLAHTGVEADLLHREGELLNAEPAVRPGLERPERLAETPDAVHRVTLDEHRILPGLGFEILC